MTAVSNRPGVGTSPSYGTLPGALIDQLAESVTLPPDSPTRSVTIAALIVEVFETVRWLHGSDPDHEELASLYRVVAEAYAHRARMAAGTGAGEPR
jgi:hypothetical protein